MFLIHVIPTFIVSVIVVGDWLLKLDTNVHTNVRNHHALRHHAKLTNGPIPYDLNQENT